MSGAPLVVVGDALLDRDLDGRVERLAPDAPVPVVDDPAERDVPEGRRWPRPWPRSTGGRWCW